MRSLTVAVVVTLLVGILHKSSLVIGIEYRLSQEVIPSSYDIKITPYFLPEDGDKQFTFGGETTIVIQNEGSEPVREFAVHADYLEFIELHLLNAAGENIEFNIQYESYTDKLYFQLSDGGDGLLPFVNYSVIFKYSGRISDGYDGLYRINYLDVEGVEKWMVATQLQRIDARKLFPCFDEPGFKAHFSMHISRPKSYNSFSNTAIYSTTIDENNNDRYVDHFERTPLMSTYLVAMIVSEFTRRGKDNVYILARPEYYNKTEFSYEVTNKILNHYNTLFGISYPDLGNTLLQKASLSKFIHNGMENWGLMIYKDDVLIFEDGYTDLSGQQYTITIISHETSHSWFGDSVTFEWWGYFWLNEGFARYYQYFATHVIYPQYELDKQFVVDQLHYILNLDALQSTQPLSEPHVASPSEIARKFSSITYVKGASIVRTISHAMTEAKFEKAIREYLAENLNGAVNPAHLLKHLKSNWPASPAVDVEQFFADWTEQVGFPLLKVTLGKNSRSVDVEQSRYLASTTDGSDASLRYTIPLTYTTSHQADFENTYPSVYFSKDEDSKTFDFPESIDWIVFNIQQTSYYRVMYDSGLWGKLHNALLADNWSGIHEINRAQMIDDLLAFAKAALMGYDVVFKWLEYLETEIAYTPWSAAFSGFTFVGPYLTVEEHTDFGEYILFVTEKVFTQLGVTGSMTDSVLDIYNRKRIVNYNCKYGRETCVTEVQKILREYLNNGVVIPVDMRSTIYCNGIRDGTEDDFDKLLESFKAESVLKEKLRIRYGLGCGRSKKNMEKFFEFILSAEIAIGDKESAMAPMYKENPETVWPAYQLVTSRCDDVAEAFGSWSSTASLISSIATLLTTTEQRDAFEEFIAVDGEKFGTSSETLESALKTLDSNLKWANTHLDPLRQYLKSRNDASAVVFVNFILILAIAHVLF